MQFGFLQYLLGIVCAASLFGIFKMNKKQHVNPKAQSVSLILLLVFVVSCGAMVMTSGMLSKIGLGKSQETVRLEGFLQARASQIYTFGNTIGSGKKVLIIVNESDKEFHDSGKGAGSVANFESAIKASAVGDNFVVAAPERSKLRGLSPDQREMMMMNVPPSEMLVAADVNKVIDANKDVDAIIFANALPGNSVAGIKAIRKNAPTPVYITEFATLSTDTVRDLLSQRAIAGAVFRNTSVGANSQKSFSSYQDAFDTLFELVTE